MTTGVTNSLFFRDSESPITGNLNMGDQDANNFINITEADTTTFGMLHLTGDATVGGNA